jgi:hypothetical protein
MTHNPRLREQLDACRSRRDLTLLEMTELSHAVAHKKAVADELARSQRFDQAVAAALHDVPVPDGLEAKLLAAVADAQAADRPSLAAAPRRGSRWKAIVRLRRTWLIATAAATLVAAALGGFYWTRSQQIIEQEQIASALGGWQRAVSSSHSEGRLPSDFVLPPLPVKPVRYVPFKTDEGWSAVAVDCTTSSGSPATLFIVRPTAGFRVAASPVARLAGPGKKVAAWRKGHLLYVLVEEVTKPRAGAMIQRSAAPPA